MKLKDLYIKHSIYRYIIITFLLLGFSLAIILMMNHKVYSQAKQENITKLEETVVAQAALLTKFTQADKMRFDTLCYKCADDPFFESPKITQILKEINSSGQRTIEILLPDNNVISGGARTLPVDITFEQINLLGNHYSGKLISAATDENIIVHYIPMIFNDIVTGYCCIILTCDYINSHIITADPYLNCSLIDYRTKDFIADSKKQFKKNLNDIKIISLNGNTAIPALDDLFQTHSKVFTAQVEGCNETVYFTFYPTTMDEYYALVYSTESEMLSKLTPYRKITKTSFYLELIIFIIFLLISSFDSHKNLLKAVSEEKNRRKDIIEILSGGYTALYYYNLETDEAEVIYLSDQLKQDTGKSIQVLSNLHDVYINFVNTLVHPDDRKAVIDAIDINTLKRRLENEKSFTELFRRNYDGQYLYTRLSVVKAGDEKDKPVHIAIGFAEVDNEFKREQARQIEMSQTLEIAYQDGLTGIKNKYAYRQAEEILDIRLTGSNVSPFAIAVFDVNDLKKTNDTLGHEAGDKLICDAAKVICNAFKHSPVYRIGGDEFSVIVTGPDYEDRDMIMLQFRNQMKENSKNKDSVVVASGIATFIDTDISCSIVFNRADEDMYLNKASLKK